MPYVDPAKSPPFQDRRTVAEGVIDRFRLRIARRDLPDAWHHRFPADGTWDELHARFVAAFGDETRSRGFFRLTPPSTAPTSTPRTRTRHEPPSHRWQPRTTPFQPSSARMPDNHAIGRCRGGLLIKVQPLVDGRGRPPTAGQSVHSPMLKTLLTHLHVARCGAGRPSEPVRYLDGRQGVPLGRQSGTSAWQRPGRDTATLRPGRALRAARISVRRAPDLRRGRLPRLATPLNAASMTTSSGGASPPDTTARRALPGSRAPRLHNLPRNLRDTPKIEEGRRDIRGLAAWLPCGFAFPTGPNRLFSLSKSTGH